MKAPIAEILLAGPRGFCAGVERAIDIVELALSVCKPPVYVRREIVHNRLVVETLRQQGAIFVDELDEVPDDATGRPEVWEQAVDAVGRGGSVLFFGGCAPGTAIRLDTRRTHYEELTLLGAFHHTPEMIRRAVEMLASGALVPDSLISHRMVLEEVGQALALMAKGEALKVLIRS